MTHTPARRRRRARLAPAALAALLALGLAACGGDDDGADATPAPPASAPAATAGEGAAPSEDIPEGAPPQVGDADLPTGESLQVPLGVQNGSGQSGTARFIPLGEGLTRVIVQLDNPPPEPQPAHIHRGTCAELDPQPAFPLKDLTGGRSETFVPASLASLRTEPFAVNVHRSAAEAATYVACGDIPSS